MRSSSSASRLLALEVCGCWHDCYGRPDVHSFLLLFVFLFQAWGLKTQALVGLIPASAESDGDREAL